MSNTPNNPLDPPPPEKGPWIYSGSSQPTPSYTPPPAPHAPAPSSAVPAAPSAPAKASGPESAPASPAPVTRVEKRRSRIKDTQDDASLGSIIDTIEAVIIALILALTFRAFVIEAFVIPTGSMAPTLLGAHFNVICPKCGYAFTRDADLSYQLIKGEIRGISGGRGELTSNSSIPCDGYDTASLICPNCQYVIPYASLPQYLDNRVCRDARTGSERNVPFAWANNGDRILVLKYIYSIHDPARWDVIVFKEPMNAQDNYIKRLIGLPGETVEIIGGDIYVTPPTGNPRDPAQRLIARKPVHVQEHLWQLVYDNDYYPIDEGPAAAAAGPYSRAQEARNEHQLPVSYAQWHNPWVGAGNNAAQWNKLGAPFATVGGPVVTYRGPGSGTLAFNPSHQTPYSFNILGYNNDIQELYRVGPANLQPSGDLRLETIWTPADAAGASVSLTVGPRRNLFRVTWSASGLELLRFNPAAHVYESVDKQTAPQPPRAGQAYRVAMNNVDHSVQFFIDGRLVLQHDVPWCAVDAFREEQEIQAAVSASGQSLFEVIDPHAEIAVGGPATLAHLKIFRDLYYTQTETNQPRTPGAATADNPFTLGSDEFFAMGDNSRRSYDGRFWATVYPALDDLGTRRGIVPRRYLLGKAIYVYWPAGYRFTDSIAVPLVPNAGDMRFIR